MTFAKLTMGPVTWLVLYGYGCVLWPSSTCRGADKLSAIVDNVAQNELLYRDIDVTVRDTYSVEPDMVVQFKNESQKETIQQERRTHFVAQGAAFRVDVEGNARQDGGKLLTRDHIRLFDGATSRLYDQKAYANITKGRVEDEHYLRPHMLLMRHAQPFGRLSTFLRGSAAMAADPEAGWHNPQLIAEGSYAGSDTFDGLQCHKIWVTSRMTKTNALYDRWEIWLAEARNYLPIRSLEYRFRFSKTIPAAENVANDLRELKPGIWFPFSIKAVHFDPLLVQREGRQVARWEYTYTVERASLDPHYPAAYFQELSIPNGTAVYEVDGGKITKSYVQGGLVRAHQPGRRPIDTKWWWVIAVNVTLLIICAVMVAKRLRLK